MGFHLSIQSGNECVPQKKVFIIIVKVCRVCVCVRLCLPSRPRDVRRIGVELIGHQRRIISSVQTLRLQLLHEQEKGFHV